MGTAMFNAYYPEDCDTTGEECLQCVRRTAESVRALTTAPTPEWAGAVFERMYSHPACMQMQHAFVWACGATAGPRLVQIRTQAA